MAASVNLKIELRDAHLSDGLQGLGANVLICRKLLDLARGDIGRQTQIVNTCSGLILLRLSGGMPGPEQCC